MDNDLLQILIKEINMENSLIEVSFLSNNFFVKNILINQACIDSNTLFLSGDTQAFIDGASLEIKIDNNLIINFDNKEKCYYLKVKEIEIKFAIAII